MKRVILISSLLVCLASLALAGQPTYFEEVSASDTNSTVDIKTGLGQSADAVIIKNDGPNAVWVDILDGVAVEGASENFRLDPDDAPLNITSGGGQYRIGSVGIITGAGDSATVRVYAFPSK